MNLRAAACALIMCGMGGGAHAAPPRATVDIVETDPAAPATLVRGDNLYVHVHYSSDAPIKLWVRPFFRGQEVSAMSNGSFVHPAGEGEAFGWFACPQACRVDSIHLQVATAGSGSPFLDQAETADFSWSETQGQWHEPAAWVKLMQQEEAARQKQAYDAYMNASLGAGGVLSLILFGAAVLGALFACFVWPIYGLIRWQGKWRWLAGAPLMLVGSKTLRIASDVSADPTSHNLLPFEYLILAAIVAPYMVVVWLLRRKALTKTAE